MLLHLPQELLEKILGDVWLSSDSDLLSVFQTCRKLAMVGIRLIYSKHWLHAHVVRCDPKDIKAVKRSIIYWRSIILSILGETIFPYHHYTHILDLVCFRDLIFHLSNTKTSDLMSLFFDGKMSKFYIPQKTTSGNTASDRRSMRLKHSSRSKRPPMRPNEHAVIGRILEVFFRQKRCTMKINTESQHYGSPILLQAKFPQLTRLEAWGRCIRYINQSRQQGYCDELPALLCLALKERGRIVDNEEFTTFVSNMRLNSLQFFACYCVDNIDAAVLSSLGKHRKSLVSLRLSIRNLNEICFLPECPRLNDLWLSHRNLSTAPSISQSSPASLWLQSCKSLRSLTLEDYKLGPNLVIKILLDETISLHTLAITYCETGFGKDFYTALSRKTSLLDLTLENVSDDEIDDADEVDIMECLLCLKSLDSLNLSNLNILFHDQQLISIAEELSSLRRLRVDCCQVTDTIWNTLSSHTCLIGIWLMGENDFTVDGVLSYVSKLAPNKQGGFISFWGGLIPREWSPEDIARVSECFKERVDGALVYNRLQLLERSQGVKYEGHRSVRPHCKRDLEESSDD